MSFTVLGGGVSGLAAAHYLTKLPIAKEIILVESSKRLGGWINTSRHDDGVMFEHGPRTVRPAGPQGANTLELVEELGLADKVKPIKYGHPATVNRLVYVNGELHKLPSGIKSLILPQPPFRRPLFLAGVQDLFTRQKKCDDEPLYDFVSRRFGQDLANFAIDPMVRGVCAGNAKEISAKSFVAGPLFKLEQEHGGILKGVLKNAIFNRKKKDESNCELVKQARSEKWNVWSLQGGMQTLVEALENKLKADGVKIVTGQEAKVSVHKNELAVNESFTDRLIISTPAHQACKILRNVNDQASKLLESIPFVDVAVVNVMYDYPDIITEPAFGFLVPSSEKDVPVLGVIYDTCSFPQTGRTVFTVMMGGRWFKEALEAEFERVAVDQLSKILSITEKPSKVVTKIQRQCIAQYTVGHADRVSKARSLILDQGLPLNLVGSSYDGVGVNDAIMSSENQILETTM